MHDDLNRAAIERQARARVTPINAKPVAFVISTPTLRAIPLWVLPQPRHVAGNSNPDISVAGQKKS